MLTHMLQSPVRMQGSRLALLAVAHLALVADSQIPPAIDPGSVVNAASRMPSSLPGGALARGVRFSLSGVRLGPAIPIRGEEAEPPAALGDVSVQVMQLPNRWSAGILYAGATRIDGVIPRSVPPGPVQLVVTYRGISSEAYATTLVDSSFGFFTQQTAPDSLPVAQQPVTAEPGQRVTLWGSGMGDIQPEVLLGGRPVVARFEAETCCQGVSRIHFDIPPNAPLGCYVPVQEEAAGRVSNVVGISIHNPGQPCIEPFDWFGHAMQNSRRAGFVVLARVSVSRDRALKLGAYQVDYGIAAFGDQHAGHRLFSALPPLGTCRVYSGRFNVRRTLLEAEDPSSWTGMPPAERGHVGLDAGEAISISGPDGVPEGPKALLHEGHGREAYSAVLGGAIPFARFAPLPLFLKPGIFRATSSGGRDVGPFDVAVQVTRAIEWSNRDRLSEIQRSAGATLEWKEARRGDGVLIAAGSSNQTTGASSLCICLAAAQDRRFRIPPIALANLPASSLLDLEPSVVMIAELPLEAPAPIDVKGLDAGFATFLSVSARTVKFR